VRSNIVLNFTEALVASGGNQKIRIINEANTAEKAGFFGEQNVNTFEFTSSSPEVTIDGSRVTIDPGRDLDFSNNYRIEIEVGAFKGASSSVDSVAIEGDSAITFSTVTPSTDQDVSTAEGQSQIMLSDGTLAASLIWKDTEGWPASKEGDSASIDLSETSLALLMVDYMADPSVFALGGAAATNVESGNFNLVLDGFGVNDLLYMDDLGRGVDQNLETEVLIFAIQAGVNAATDTTPDQGLFNFDPATGKEGGALVVNDQTFGILEWLNTGDFSAPPSDQFVYG